MIRTAFFISIMVMIFGTGVSMAQDCEEPPYPYVIISVERVTTPPCDAARLSVPVYMTNECPVGGFTMQIYVTNPEWLLFDPEDTLAADTAGSRNTNWGNFSFQVNEPLNNRITVTAIWPGGDSLLPGEGLLFTIHPNLESNEVSDVCQLLNFGDTDVSAPNGYDSYPVIVVRDSVCVDSCDAAWPRGDANRSETLNGLDVTFLISYFKGGASICLGCLCTADANGSGTVNGLDVTFLINYFKGGPAPEPEWCY